MEKLLLDEKEVLSKYSELKSIHKVSHFFGVSISPISRILKKNNIELTNRRYEVDETYFDKIDSEEKAYWLGFLFADGYIRERSSGHSLELKLSHKDAEHLKLFREHLKSNHLIVESYNSVKYKNGISKSHMFHLAIYSFKLVDSIKKQGIHSRKTFTIDAPDIENDLKRHFIRGYFDGDGSFSFNPNNGKNCTSIVSASEKFRKFLVEELSRNDIKINLYDKIRLQIQNKLDNLKFYNYIYSDCKICLERKKETYEKFRKHYRYNN